MAVRVVVDVEMCGVQVRTKSCPYKNEIIQIGAVMMDDGFKILGKFSTYVRPRHGKIDHYIGTLTGISERALKEAPDIEEALRRFVQWIGDNDVVFYSWSTTDYYQIRKEILYKCHEDETWSVLLEASNWVDYQEKLGKRLDSPRRLKLAEKIGRQPEYARSLGISVCMHSPDRDNNYRARRESQEFRYTSTDK